MRNSIEIFDLIVCGIEDITAKIGIQLSTKFLHNSEKSCAGAQRVRASGLYNETLLLIYRTPALDPDARHLR